jgi:hypothetical protein
MPAASRPTRSTAESTAELLPAAFIRWRARPTRSTAASTAASPPATFTDAIAADAVNWNINEVVVQACERLAKAGVNGSNDMKR